MGLIEEYSNYNLMSLFEMAIIVNTDNILSFFDYVINKNTLIPRSEIEKFYNHERVLKEMVKKI